MIKKTNKQRLENLEAAFEIQGHGLDALNAGLDVQRKRTNAVIKEQQNQHETQLNHEIRITDGVQTSNHNEGMTVKMIEHLDSRVEGLEDCVDTQHKSRLVLEDKIDSLEVSHEEMDGVTDVMSAAIGSQRDRIKKLETVGMTTDNPRYIAATVTNVDMTKIETKVHDRLHAEISMLLGEEKKKKEAERTTREALELGRKVWEDIRMFGTGAMHIRPGQPPVRIHPGSFSFRPIPMHIRGSFRPTTRDIEILEKSNRERLAKIGTQSDIISKQAHTIAKKGRSNAILSKTNEEIVFQNSQLRGMAYRLEWKNGGLKSDRKRQSDVIQDLWRNDAAQKKAISELQNDNMALRDDVHRCHHNAIGRVIDERKENGFPSGTVDRLKEQVASLKIGNKGYRERNSNQKGIIQTQAKQIEDLQGKFECLDKAYQRRYTQAEVRGKEIEGLQGAVSRQNATISQLKAYKNELVDRNGILVDFITKVNDALPAANSANQILNQAACKVREWVRADS